MCVAFSLFVFDRCPIAVIADPLLVSPALRMYNCARKSIATVELFSGLLFIVRARVRSFWLTSVDKFFLSSKIHVHMQRIHVNEEKNWYYHWTRNSIAKTQTLSQREREKKQTYIYTHTHPNGKYAYLVIKEWKEHKWTYAHPKKSK